MGWVEIPSVELKRFKLWFSGHLAVGTVGRGCGGFGGRSSSRRDVDVLLVLGRRVESPLFNFVGHLSHSCSYY